MPYFEPPPTSSSYTAPDKPFLEVLEGEIITGAYSLSAASNRPIFLPFWVEGNNLSCKTVRLLVSVLGGSPAFSLWGGIYSMVNSTQISRLTSNSQFYSGASATYSGVRAIELTNISGAVLTEGRWILGINFYALNSFQNNFVLMGGQTFPSLAGTIYQGSGSSATSATNNSDQMVPFWGVYSGPRAVANVAATIARSEIYGIGSASRPDVYAYIGGI